MNPSSSLSGIGFLLGAMACFALLEALLPLHKRNSWNKQHLVPNLALTFLTFATNLLMNIPMLAGLIWLQSMGWGLFNVVEVHPLLAFAGAILMLDLAWYVTHVSMHKSPALWRLHLVHHSDPAVDVTTAIRQHPGESLVRYVFLAGFGFAIGAAPAAFAVYRVWSALHGMFEHANLKLPLWLDTAISPAPICTRCTIPETHNSPTEISRTYFRSGTACLEPSRRQGMAETWTTACTDTMSRSSKPLAGCWPRRFAARPLAKALVWKRPAALRPRRHSSGVSKASPAKCLRRFSSTFCEPA